MNNIKKAMENPTNRPPSTPDHRTQVQHHQEDDDHDEEFTCEICTETASLPNKRFRNGGECAHPFCTNCVIKYIRAKLGDYNTGHIKCPAPDCPHTLDPLTCAPLIDRSLFLRWCDVLCQAAIVGWEACHCPHRDCNVLILNECGGSLSLSTCPLCKRWFCFRCKTFWHRTLSCRENMEAEPLRNMAARKRWQSCPSCNEYVELAEGCTAIICRCGIAFCYKCGRPTGGHYCYCERQTILGRVLCVVGWFIALAIIFFLIWLAWHDNVQQSFNSHASQ